MNSIMSIVGALCLGGLAAGCDYQPLSDFDATLPKYDTNDDQQLTGGEPRLLILGEFDKKPHDGRLSDEEVLDAMHYARTIPDKPSSQAHLNEDYDAIYYGEARRNIFEAIAAQLNEQAAQEKTEKSTAEKSTSE